MIVKMSDRRKAKYEQVADIVDLTLSEWVRRVLDAEVERIESLNQDRSE